MPDEPWLTNSDAAKKVGLGHSTLTLYIRNKQLVPTRTTPGGQARWHLDDLITQLDGMRETRQEEQRERERRQAEDRRSDERHRGPDPGR